MIAAERPVGPSGKLLTVGPDGRMRHRRRTDLASLFGSGDVVVVNDAATLPASLRGFHVDTGRTIEVRLAGWVHAGDPTRFVAVVFGAGDHRTRTEDRPAPPALSRADLLRLGPLFAVIEKLLADPRLVALRLLGDRRAILAGLARHGRPIQYAHVPAPLAIRNSWTRIAADPVAFEPPSAGFALDWRTLADWRRRGVQVVALTHAAGISSTGDPLLDRRLPFDEPYRIPERTATTVNAAIAEGRRVIAIGTTVVRALESAVRSDRSVRAGGGIARNRIGPQTRLRVVDAILTGVHPPGESHFELLRAFAGGTLLHEMSASAEQHGYLAHEFGDSMLLERQAGPGPPYWPAPGDDSMVPACPAPSNRSGPRLGST